MARSSTKSRCGMAARRRRQNVQPVIELPQELTLLKAEPENKVEGGKISFDPVATMPPNNRATFRVRAKAVQPSLGARVTAELSGDPFPTGPVRRQELTAIGGNPPAPVAPPRPSGIRSVAGPGAAAAAAMNVELVLEQLRPPMGWLRMQVACFGFRRT